MPTILDPTDLETTLRRLEALTPSSTPRWGRFTVVGMLGHLHESARMALGEQPVEPKGPRMLRRFPFKQLLLYVVPFPRGAPTAPELLRGVPAADFEAEKDRLVAALRRIAAGPREGPGPPHPLFGPLSRQEWGVAMHKHNDHHLRQFGV